MTKISILFILTLLLFAQCKNIVPSVNLVNSADHDIVLVNIEEGDRSFLGKILLKLDSLKPVVIGVDVYFRGRKTNLEDSVLIDALRKVKNDILNYGLDSNNTFEHSDSIFLPFVKDQGFLNYERTLGFISNMTPLPRIDDKIYESFAYKIVKYWEPDFKPTFEINEQIPINYQRTLDNFLRLNGSFLLETNIDNFDLKDKIVLLGYIGPGKEDKYFTPLRIIGKEIEPDEPDTYGLVIIANQIRTILNYKR